MLKFSRLLSALVIPFILSSHAYATDSPRCVDDLASYVTLNFDQTGQSYVVLTLGWLNRCELRNEDIPQVITYLHDHANIRGLFIGSEISVENVILIAKKVDLKYLAIHYQTSLGDIGAEAIAANPTITELELPGDGIGVKGAAALAKNQTLKKLDLQLNPIGDSGASEFSKNNTLEQLNVDRDNIGDAGAQAFAKMNSLNKLSLVSNHVGNTGAEALAKNHSLSTLNLTDNKIDDSGADALSKSTSLSQLYLNYNNIQNAGALSFTFNHSNLKMLSIVCNQIGYIGIAALATLHFEIYDKGNPGSGSMDRCERPHA